MAYIYRASFYCDECGQKLIEELRQKGIKDTGDSDDFQQYASESQEVDVPYHCESCNLLIDFKLTFEAIDYMVKGLFRYIKSAFSRYNSRRRGGDQETLDQWSSKLSCNYHHSLDWYQQFIVDVYDMLRRYEEREADRAEGILYP